MAWGLFSALRSEEAGGGGSWQGCWWELGPGKKGAFQSQPAPLVPAPPRLRSPGAHRVPCLAQEFENAEGEEFAADFSAQGSPAAAAPNGPDVYVLPLTEVSLPMAKQPGRSGE